MQQATNTRFETCFGLRGSFSQLIDYLCVFCMKRTQIYSRYNVQNHPAVLTLHNYWELLVLWQSQYNGFWWFGRWFFQDVDWRQATYLAAMPSTFALPPSWSWSVAKFTKSLRTSNWSLAVHYIRQSPCNLWLVN